MLEYKTAFWDAVHYQHWVYKELNNFDAECVVQYSLVVHSPGIPQEFPKDSLSLHFRFRERGSLLEGNQ